MELDQLLEDAGHVTGPSAQALRRGRSALDTPITAGGGSRFGRRGGSSRTRNSLLIAAALVAGLLAIPAVSFNGDPPASNAAAAVLHQAGEAAGRQPGGWPNAKYWHSVSTYKYADGRAGRREVWIGHQANGVLKDPDFSANLVPLGVADFPAGASGLSWDELYALPTDPRALNSRLRSHIDGAGNSDDSEMFVIVGDLLRESPASPALRRALYEVAATIPGVKLLGTMTDHAGRTGTAIERDHEHYIIDTSNGRLLEEGLLDDKVGPNDDYETYDEQGPAGSAPAAPGSPGGPIAPPSKKQPVTPSH